MKKLLMKLMIETYHRGNATGKSQFISIEDIFMILLNTFIKWNDKNVLFLEKPEAENRCPSMWEIRKTINILQTNDSIKFDSFNKTKEIHQLWEINNRNDVNEL